MSFKKKLINVSIQMTEGNFQGGGNTATISGLRVSASIENAGGPSQGSAHIAIYGLPLSIMNQLSTVGPSMSIKQDNNNVAVYAGEEGGQMALVYEGSIHLAYVDAQAMPQVAFRIESVGRAWDAVNQVTPVSHSGSTDVAGMFSALAGKMGLTFENNGVNVKLMNPYYSGSPWAMATRMARHANVAMVVDRGVLSIAPAGQAREGAAFLISPQTGMVGYPNFNEASVIVKALYDPALKYNGQIQIKSDLTPANGTWTATKIVYDLESLVPHGRWFMTVTGTNGQIGPNTQ